MGWLLYPYRRIRRYFARKNFLKLLENEVAEEFLQVLLKLLRYSCYLDSYLRESMKGFNGLIQFRSKDNEIRVLAEFKKGRLKDHELKPNEELKETPNAHIVFKNADAVKNFLLPKGGIAGRRDVLRSLLKNEVKLEGNYNYIYRFGFLANHLQLQVQKLLG